VAESVIPQQVPHNIYIYIYIYIYMFTTFCILPRDFYLQECVSFLKYAVQFTEKSHRLAMFSEWVINDNIKRNA
jgi:hypothetical protein